MEGAFTGLGGHLVSESGVNGDDVSTLDPDERLLDRELGKVPGGPRRRRHDDEDESYISSR